MLQASFRGFRECLRGPLVAFQGISKLLIWISGDPETFGGIRGGFGAISGDLWAVLNDLRRAHGSLRRSESQYCD